MLAGLFPRPSPKHGPNLSVFPKADTTPVTDLIDHAADLPLAPPGPEVLVIAAHSQLEHARINRRLMRAAAGGAATLEVRDLYAPYPDDLIDTKAEQALLKSARLVVVWQDPIHRYSMPPLTKRWVGEMLAFGWAGPGRAGPGGTALRGKDLWRVATTGGPEQPYHPDRHLRYFFDAFLPPCAQTAALCGMRFRRRGCCMARTEPAKPGWRPTSASAPSAGPATRTGPNLTTCATAWPAPCRKTLAPTANPQHQPAGVPGRFAGHAHAHEGALAGPHSRRRSTAVPGGGRGDP